MACYFTITVYVLDKLHRALGVRHLIVQEKKERRKKKKRGLGQTLTGFLNISRQEFFALYIYHHHLRSRVKVAFFRY